MSAFIIHISSADASICFAFAWFRDGDANHFLAKMPKKVGMISTKYDLEVGVGKDRQAIN